MNKNLASDTQTAGKKYTLVDQSGRECLRGAMLPGVLVLQVSGCVQ